MYIDNGGDPGDSGELKIDVDGHEYTEQENYSAEHNGVIDSVAIDTADGHHLVYSDDHHSGTADVVTEYDAQGDEVRTAHFDADTGRWIDTDGSGQDDGSGSAAGDAGHGGGAESMSVDTPGGERNIGPATVDTTNSGHPDTAVVHDGNGDTIMYTDTNGDGQADVATEITPDGHVVIAEHTGAHQWTVVEKGHLDGDGRYHSDGEASGPFDPQVGTPAAEPGGSSGQDVADDHYWTAEQAATTAGAEAETATISQAVNSMFGAGQGVVRIDSGTGQWISPN